MFARRSIAIKFYFDDSGRLTRYTMDEKFTGP
jgi:hypothetical protein